MGSYPAGKPPRLCSTRRTGGEVIEHGTAHDGPGAGSVPREPVCRARRDGAAVLRGMLRDLRPRQRRGRRPGPPAVRRRHALLPGPQRAGDGPRRLGLRPPEEPPPDPRLHHLHRTGRDQHGHGRGPCHDKPPTRAAPAWRRFRLAQARPRPAAARSAPRRNPLGQRLLRASLAVLRQGRAARAADTGHPRRDTCAHEPGRDGGCDPGASAGRTDGSLRLPWSVFREAGVARGPPEA